MESIITSSLTAIALIAIFFLCVYIYFVPTFIAFKRKHNARMAILLVNIFFGWCFIGWIASLVWAYGINTEKNFSH